jgi:hypothetical protein
LKNIQHLNPKELEEWGHCWKIQENINENTPGTPAVLFRGYNHVWFFEITKICEERLKEQNEKKRMLKEQQKQTSNFVLNNGDGNGYDDGNGYGDDNNSDVDGNSDADDDDDNNVPDNNNVPSIPSHVFSPSLPSVPSSPSVPSTNVPAIPVPSINVPTIPVPSSVPVASSVSVVPKNLLTPEQIAVQYKDLIGGADQ